MGPGILNQASLLPVKNEDQEAGDDIFQGEGNDCTRGSKLPRFLVRSGRGINKLDMHCIAVDGRHIWKHNQIYTDFIGNQMHL